MEHQSKIVPSDSTHGREAVRDSLFLTAIVRRTDNGCERTVRVRNLSAGGMMADSANIFVRDDRVEITMRGVGTIGGRIAWNSSDKIGVAFDGEIDPKAARKPVGADGLQSQAKPRGALFKPKGAA